MNGMQRAGAVLLTITLLLFVVTLVVAVTLGVAGQATVETRAAMVPWLLGILTWQALALVLLGVGAKK